MEFRAPIVSVVLLMRVCVQGPVGVSRSHQDVRKSATHLMEISSPSFAQAAVSSALPGERRGRRMAALVSPFALLCLHPALSGNDIKSLKRLQAAFKVGARPNSPGPGCKFFTSINKKKMKKELSCPVHGRPRF